MGWWYCLYRSLTEMSRPEPGIPGGRVHTAHYISECLDQSAGHKPALPHLITGLFVVRSQKVFVHPLRELANCGKLRKALVLDGHEFKPHRKGSWGQGPNQQWHAAHGMGHGAKSLTSISMLPPPLVKKCGVPGGPEPRA